MPWAAQVEGYNTPPDGLDMSCLGTCEYDKHMYS